VDDCGSAKYPLQRSKVPGSSRVPVRDEQTHPHRPRLVVSYSTCPPLSSPPHANSFVIGPEVIKLQNTHTPRSLVRVCVPVCASERERERESFIRNHSPCQCDGQTSPLRPRLVVSHSTCPPTIPLPPREQLCNRYCSNKHTLIAPLEAFSLNASRLLGLLVPKPRHSHCMQRTHSLKTPPSESCPACIVGVRRGNPD
jgi:hypothetical protein